jgi:hypothetical protein
MEWAPSVRLERSVGTPKLSDADENEAKNEQKSQKNKQDKERRTKAKIGIGEGPRQLERSKCVGAASRTTESKSTSGW